MPVGRIPGTIGTDPSNDDAPKLVATQSSTYSTEVKASNEGLEKAKTEAMLDMGQLILDLTGILDPTPISDGSSAIISLARGNWLDAAISAVSIVPYVGDVTKSAKLPRYLESIRNAVYIAKRDSEWAAHLRESFIKLNAILDQAVKLGTDILPKDALNSLKRIKGEVDEFLNPKMGGANTKKKAAGASGGSQSSGPAHTPSQLNGNGNNGSGRSDSSRSSNSSAASKKKQTKEASQANESTKESGKTESNQCTPANPKCQGEPVSMVTGEELLEQVDFTLPGPIPLIWQRTYRSSNSKDSGIGAGWMGPGYARLMVSSDKVDFKDQQGRHIPFKKPKIGDGCLNTTEKLTLYCDSEQQFRITDAAGQVFVFKGEFAFKRLQKISNADGHSIQYHRNRKGRLDEITDSAGRRLKLDYNITSHISAIYLLDKNGEKQGNALVEYRYDNGGDLIAVTDGNGNKETFVYKNHIITQRTTRDGFNFHFEWDQYDNKGKCIRNWGDRGVYDYRFEYDAENKVTRSTDGRGNTSEFHYNDMGLITKEVDPEGGVTRFEYNDNGNLIKQTDPLGNVTRSYYNSKGQLSKVVNASNESTTIHYNKMGKPISLTDSQGKIWQRVYDNKGRVNVTTDPSGASTQYRYDKAGNLSSVTDAAGRTQSYQWNEKGELIAQTDAAGNCSQYEYDARGQVTKVTDSRGKQTLYFYDGSGNITQVFHPNNSSIQMQYTPGGHLTHHIDAIGRTTQYRYDGLSQPVERVDPNGQHFLYEYDEERNLTALINENSERYELHYDKSERLIKEVGFDGRTQHYSYNAAGQLILHTDGANRMTQFSRDEHGRLAKKKSSDGELSQFNYDTQGRLIEARNDHSKLSFKYDAVGRLIEEWQNGQIVQHRYNNIGQKTQTVLPDLNSIEYEYDDLGLFTQVSYNGEVVTQVQRDQQGREVGRSSGKFNSQFDYDPMGRLIRQRTAKDKDHNPILERTYRYNKAGNLKIINDLKHGITKFHYDALDRLHAVQGPIEERFAFDPAGNILDEEQVAQAKTQGYSTGLVKGNRLEVFQDYRFEYDDAGNLITEKKGKQETHFSYNAQNQLVKVEKEGQAFQYQYDPFGRRIKKTDAFGETTFVWSGDTILSEQRKNLNISYLHEPNSFIPLAQVRDGKVYHYHNDHLGTPQMVTDRDGDVVWEARYKVYGSVVQYEVEAIENPIRFQGQYFDSETGLHYNRHRYYHPVVGRFTTVDPIGLLGGENNYAYAPNPVTWIDPLGLSAKRGDCGGANKIPDDYDLMEDMAVTNQVEKQAGQGFVRESEQLFNSLSDIPSNLHFHEFLALRTYTSDFYQPMNRLLRSSTGGPEWGPVNTAATNALDKLHQVPGRQHQGVSYRGTSMAEEKVHERFPDVGEKYSDKGFSSSTANPNKSFSGNVQMTIKGKSGTKIDDLSAFPAEDEALFKPNTEYNITKKEQSADGTWNIELEEID